MFVTADAPIEDPRLMALWVKNLIEGLAKGFAPMMKIWGLPPIYNAGIHFEYEQDHGSGREEFASPLRTFKRQAGDCDDLVIYRISGLLSRGIPASCRTFWYGQSMHVQVRRQNKNGSRTWVEDPSIALGAPVSCPKKLLWDL